MLCWQEPKHVDANIEYVIEDMMVMSDFELHKLCDEYEVRTVAWAVGRGVIGAQVQPCSRGIAEITCF